MHKYILIFSSLFFFTQAITAETTRIMLLGDSITADWAFSDEFAPRPYSKRHGYRSHLWYMLKDANYDVDFVGTRVGGTAIRPVFDPDHEGYSGISAIGIANGVGPRLGQFAPHIVVLHIGTNDWSSNTSDIEEILNQIDIFEEHQDFHIKVILAKIINTTRHSPIFSALNRNIQIMANRRIANGDDLVVVDMEHGAGLRYDTRDFRDYIHPNNSGYRKMATVWFNALKKVLDNQNQSDYTFLVPIYGMLLN